MSFDVFKGEGPLPKDSPVYQSMPDLHDAMRRPEDYIAGVDLARAVNVALTLAMPLLVTGEPGTGKTDLAYRVAHELKLGAPLRFDTKSSSQAADLFYRFDHVRHFSRSQVHALQQLPAPDAREFVQYHALGDAILRSRKAADIANLVPHTEGWDGPRQLVVLIDEIDKAPRDFPNDLLSQIERLEFSVPELGTTLVRADREFAPIVIITSNSEKQLPEPFLRRCIYHHIDFPKDRSQIEKVLGARLKGMNLAGPGYEQAVKFFYDLRDAGGVQKKPSTSELLEWLHGLSRAGMDWKRDLRTQDKAQACIGCLAKTEDDRKLAQALLKPAV